MPQDFRDVDPRELRLPLRGVVQTRTSSSSRSLDSEHRLSACHHLWVYEAADGVLVVYNGLTRATRIAKLAPGATIRVEVVGRLRRAYAGEPKIGDHLP